MTYPSPDNLKDESFSCNLLYDCSSLYDAVASGGGAATAADVIQSVLWRACGEVTKINMSIRILSNIEEDPYTFHI